MIGRSPLPKLNVVGSSPVTGRGRRPTFAIVFTDHAPLAGT